ncbi:MAG: hypothetical protein COZ06_05350 [Armatimonadetes bacterium CG_4_10_14_3_um_filter_66_18]|nr:DUF4380 domain-containing protein [Armatimonadota bacterium]OIO98958.1 MAG: hypothetical protein AUJ96_20290 [Armatimonadetes bacterium CG2_30_66_41]PIU95458.1 MAG: hypothetical protein COS65_02325 [Armatimonadetes bacterium CG06_land_8_20_14_3_00_66_21]PIX37246.1 MAG: hypothetical protein COZ57_35360 [Armatimonadetes bacterium CG_4_8_14_3_um_filter_66_20]PIY51218.1 MAG: hypothetical protein COZ06_05350 [Armatimonadetes bacterium CG_4_10_14_3_um_filter_66_18]PIZ44055.1 MAG: hypothetical pro
MPLRRFFTPVRRLCLLCVSLALCGSISASQFVPNDVEVDSLTYRGWGGAYRLRNSVAEVILVPAAGGRVLSYRLNDSTNVLWENEAESGRLYDWSRDQGTWRNYGGYKLWVAPQDRAEAAGWHASQDNYRCQVRLTEESEVRLIAPPLEATGTQFTVALKLFPRSSRVRFRQKIRNVSQQPVRWSVWDVTQLRPGGTLTFPRNPNSRFPDGVRYWREECRELPQWEIGSTSINVQAGETAAKIGADSDGGWLSYRNGEQVYVKSFRYDPTADYPDGGCSVEVYTCPQYLEAEVLSPLYDLQPGEERVFTEEWVLQRIR